MYYAATTPNEGRELRKYDGTTTTLIEIQAGAASSDPEYLTNVNGVLYFAATTTANGRELYKYDGTNYTLINIHAGAASSSPEHLTNVNGTLYFVAHTAASGTELYKYDGTNYTLIEVESGVNSSTPQNLTNVNSTLYFTATTLANGTELYKYDGTTLTLIEVEIGGDSSDPAYLTNVNGTLYFVATTTAAGDELYKYEGIGSTATLIEIEPGPGGSFPNHLTAVNDTLYCSATTLNNGTELYKQSGSNLDLIDIEVGTDNSNPTALTNVNGILYFAATTTTNGNELYKYDGANRTLLEVISGTEGINEVGNLVSFNGAAYFSANTPSTGAELFKTDGTPAGTSMVKDLWTGIYGSYPSSFTTFNGKFYFSADYNPSDSTYGIELWTLGSCTPSNSIITNEGEHLGYNSQVQISPATQSCHCDVLNQLVASVNAVGATPVTGTINMKEWIDATTTASHVKRHYELNPSTNPTTVTGKITLYFTQAEFNEFNTLSTADLPANDTDAAGKANLRIKKYNGISSDGTGAQNTYMGLPASIDPADSDIVWNATASRWEVSFDAVGFGGFFAAIPAASNINVSLVTPPAFYCAGSTINVNYTSADLTFNTGNTFTLQLSDASGSFASPVALKTVTSTATNGSISATIPWTQTAGTGYRVRVVSSNAAFMGTNNGSNVEIKVSTATSSITRNGGILANPSASGQTNPLITGCQGASILLTAVTSNASSHQWFKNGVPIGNVNDPTLTVNTGWGDYQLIAYDVNGCGAAGDTIGISLKTAPVATGGLDRNICQGTTTTIGSLAQAHTTYTWAPNNGHLSSIYAANPTVLATLPSTTTYNLQISKSYTVLEVNVTCTSAIDPVLVTLKPQPAAPTIMASATNVCQGSTITLTASNVVGSLRWLVGHVAGATTNPLNVTSTSGVTKTYTAQNLGANGCYSVASNSVNATIQNAPVPTITSSVGTDASNIIKVCPGITNATLSATVTAGTPTYTWFNPPNLTSIGAGNTLHLMNIATTNKSYYVRATYVYGGLTCTKNSVTKAIRQDATATNCRVMQNEEETFENALSAYPNPTEKVLNAKIQVTEAGEATLTLTNSLGQNIWSEKRNLEEGDTDIQLSLETLPAGIYILSFDKENVHQSVKVIKE
ncbi:MAG: T9SS type A sorting domain-containing protein, partial [Bacteroidia bacterium]